MHGDPLAFFLTWPTYGTWLPGDARGWTEYRHGWQMPDPARELESSAKMKEDACILTLQQRELVQRQVKQTCEHRGWTLHGVSCRSNHIHLVVTAVETHPKKVRIDIKAWCTRRLKQAYEPSRENWWAERGSQRFINDEFSLHRAIEYTREAQDRKHLSEG